MTTDAGHGHGPVPEGSRATAAARSDLHRVRLVRELQDRAARAVPAAVQEHRDGCWLRHTDSVTTWWAGAALVHGAPQVHDLTATISVAEAFYAAHGARPRFQVCPACPPRLDDALALRAYERDELVSLQTAAVGDVARRLPVPAARVDLAERPDPSWLRLRMTAQGSGADPAPEWRLLQRVDRASAYATARVSGRPVAVGRAVADAGWTGVFDMATLPDGRQRGAASAVLASLAEWAGRRGSAHLYLQVTCSSAAALALYRRAGFAEVCTYHYRTAPRC